MDDETKAKMLERINEIEGIDVTTKQAVGLKYQQNDIEHRSAHFDLTPLKTALQAYADGYDAWCDTSNYDAMKAAWMEVGKAQRNVPAHVAQEYCNEECSFEERSFNEPTLPRSLDFYNVITEKADTWFPFAAPHSSFGVDFAVIVAGYWIRWR